MLAFILFLVFCTIVLIGYTLVPAMYQLSHMINVKRSQKMSTNMEQIMSRKEAKKMGRFFILAPILLAAVLYFIAPEGFQVPGAVLGFFIGLIFPSFYIKMVKQQVQEKFGNQLIDALMIMSSSFRGGLSLIQAMEAVVDEMPDPINKEFGIVLGENKMGVSLEEALYHLYERMPINALQQMITAILLARETGGNLPIIFNRIVTNIREVKKIRQNIQTLTLQGKIQGVVMSLLPVAFVSIVYSSNRRVFDNMLASDVGRGMLIYAAISWVLGGFFVWKISTIKDF
ncbi:hypothetical protein MNBD_UNCLBAC01-1586 [hydrothermal vent metagenome]|uniref:Type II secretion system protein GspF domain-containing protein n=1 Tax=hydrothermal vent metagenome TaxID=652676 RepID=A0A3B1E006_9ZZZZ